MSNMAFIESHDEVFSLETQTQVFFAPVSHGVDAAKAAIIARRAPIQGVSIEL
jgi:hypothetical protein